MTQEFRRPHDTGALTPPSEQEIEKSPRLSEAERRQVLVQFNQTGADFPEEICAHQLVEEQAASHPDRLALRSGAKEVSYEQLNRRANQLAHYLQEQGVGPERCVAVLLDRSVEMVVAVLAVLKAGGAYVPIDVQLPAERVSLMITDAAAPVVLTQEPLLERLVGAATQAQVICLARDWEQIAGRAETNPASKVRAENLAYVIYTSGSTGRPKGVEVEHRRLINLIYWHQRQYGVRAGDRATQLAGLSFDASVWELWPYLSAGASIHLPEQQTIISPADLKRWLQEEEVTHCFLPTPLAELVIGEEWPSGVSLRWLLTGGDKLHGRPRPGLGFRVVNHYGPTESTVVATAAEVEPEELGGRAPTIGSPIANTQVYLLDEGLEPVGVGVAGELYIGGAGLARGYLHEPGKTAEKFVPHPYSEKAGARLYRSGDVARYLADGNIEFLGRADEQVKIRGYRIELGEIESVLERQPAVRQAIVMVREDQRGEKRLVAYLLVHEQGAEINALRQFLKAHLPEYMVPAAFVQLTELPLTPSGKVDRRALPVPEFERSESEAFVAPGSPVEKALAEIFAEVLGLQSVSVHDNFFELGGHSLLATQVTSRLRDTLLIELSVNDVFEHPTVARLAGRAEGAGRSEPSRPHASIAPVAREGYLPLSFAQERAWFIQQLYPANIAYNFQATFRFTGPLDVTALERSLSEIVKRHEIFRTTFPAVRGRPAQLIHEPYPVSLPLIDLQGLDPEVREAEAQRLIGERFQEPFDMTQLALVRWALLRLSAQEHVMVQIEHHLVHDGWSFNVFLSELVELYRAFSAGKPSPLPEPTLQFADFAVWQRQWMQGEAAESQLAYWKEQLSGAQGLLELPTDRPRPSVKSFRGKTQRIELPVELCESLRALSRHEGVTLFMTMFAALVVLLHRYSGQDDICIGSAIANRRWRETERIIGMIINNLVLRSNVSGNPTFRELLADTRRVTLEAYEHQDVSFDLVVEALQPERSLGHNPLFQLMFGFHDSPLPSLEIPELKIDLLEGLSNGSAKFDMSVIVIPRSEQSVTQGHSKGSQGITLLWEYSTDLFTDATITRLVGDYLRVLEAVVINPEEEIEKLPQMSEAERRKVLVEWNDTTTSYPRESCIHELFETQVERSPEAVAVMFGDEQLSYRELNARANQLAHYLRKQGVGPETLVGVVLERSVELAVGLVAILKAGAAYLPLDPEYPSARLAFMMEDAGVSMLLTQQRLLDALSGQHAEVLSRPMKVLCLDSEWAKVLQESEQNPAAGATADNLAYVIYTSGSSGTPKGVAVPHRAVIRLVKGNHYVRFGADEVFLQLAPVSFDASTFELWGSLLHGSRLVIMPPETPSLAELGETLRRYGVTTLWLTAGLFHLMVDERLEDLRGVRQLLAGGDVLSPGHVERYLAAAAEGVLINGYGPTENTTFSCTYRMEAGWRLAGRSVPIGRPIANTQVYVLDRQLQPAPIGVTGELYLAGDGLARDYLRRPELTAERFVPHPYSESPGARMYRTGDQVRWLADGTLEFLGRIDQQVKIRGFRIELGEIENALAQHPGVRDVAVLAREDVTGDKQLVAYLITEPGAAPDVSEWGDWLSKRLPKYAHPSAFMTLPEFPLTPNGKVDRRALPAPEFERSESEAFVAPGSPVEKALAQIFAEVLGLQSVSVHDDFFELGGHSLRVSQVVSRVREWFAVELPLRSLFEKPNVAEFAELVEEGVLANIENLSEEEAQQGL